MDRLEGGYLGAKPTWGTGTSPGVWTLSQALARRAAGTWPATSFLYDPYFESVSLLLHMNGSNGSTTFADSSLNSLAVTAAGNAQISTAQSKFGGASAYFDGTGDYLSISTNSVFNFGAGAFTVETWVRFSSASGQQCIASNYGSSTAGWSIQLFGGTIIVNLSGDGVDITGTTVISANTWYHVALSGSTGAIRLFINGTQEGSTYAGAVLLDTSSSLNVGAITGTATLNGYLDEVRITKGVARYTANFTVPGVSSDEGAALYDPYFDYVSLLLSCNGANNSTTFTDNSNNAFAITPFGDTKIAPELC